MAVTFKRFDPAAHLDDEETIRAFLTEAAEGGPAVLISALASVARARNMSALARSAGMSREGLYKALSSDGNPSFANVMNILKAMHLELTLAPAKPSPARKAPAKRAAKARRAQQAA
jgi:probable addiction module antidote protein